MNLEAYRISSEPFYQPVGDEIAVFEAAFAERLPVMLKGPTGCGKTRFVEHMAWRLGKPLVTVAAHEDMTASDLAGRYLLEPDGHRLARRPADHGGPIWRDLLSRRNRRSPAGHHGGDPPADRCAANSAAGEAQRDRACPRRFPADDLLQSRLSERGQGSEGIDQAALSRDRFQLSAAGGRSRHHGARSRNRYRTGRNPGRHRGALAQPCRATASTKAPRRAC